MIAALLLAAGPVLYWPQPLDSGPALRAAGVTRLCAPAASVAAWQTAGFDASACQAAGRTALKTLGLVGRAEVAAPTQRPWINANGWRFLRRPADRYWYDAPSGRAVLALCEAFAYGIDGVVAIAPEDLAEAGRALSFLASVPAADLPSIADVTVVDDGTGETAEVLNLLARRNVLYAVAARAPREGGGLVVRLGSKEFPRKEAADPDAIALKVRRTLGDESRSLRIYGTEVVLARVQGDSSHRRVHLLNYAGRPIEGIRVRLRGRWAPPAVRGLDPSSAAEDYVVTDDATELSLSVLGPYAVLDFAAGRPEPPAGLYRPKNSSTAPHRRAELRPPVEKITTPSTPSPRTRSSSSVSRSGG